MIFFEINEIGPTPGVSKRNMNKILKGVWTVGVQWWHAKIRPKHFTQAGADEYRYRDPSIKYQLRKLRKFGHERPMVFTGRGEKMAATGRITANKNRGRVIMDAPVFNFKPLGYDKPLREQLLRISPDDLTVLTRIMKKKFLSSVKSLKGKRKRRIK